MHPGLPLALAGLASAVVAVGLDLALFERYGTYVDGGDLVARGYLELTAIGALGPLLALALLALLAGPLAGPGNRRRFVLATCASLLAAGALALVAGVGTAAALGFRLEADTAVIAVSLTVFLGAYWALVRRAHP